MHDSNELIETRVIQINNQLRETNPRTPSDSKAKKSAPMPMHEYQSEKQTQPDGTEKRVRTGSSLFPSQVQSARYTQPSQGAQPMKNETHVV